MLRIAPGIAIPLEEIRMSASTSGGPGGQHANRSSTRVELRFDVLASPSLSAAHKARIREALGGRLAADGTLRVASRRERSQLRNRRAALERLGQLLTRALERPAPRTATRPTAASKKRRAEAKQRRARIKAGRTTARRIVPAEED